MYVDDNDIITVYDELTDTVIAKSEAIDDLTLVYSNGTAVSMRFESDDHYTFNGFKFYFEFFGKYVVPYAHTNIDTPSHANTHIDITSVKSRYSSYSAQQY